MYDIRSAEFWARLWFCDTDGQIQRVVWDNVLSPVVCPVDMSIEEWASNYIEDWSWEELADRFDIKEPGEWEVVFHGRISGGWCGPPSDEYDEEIDVISYEKQRLPDNFLFPKSLEECLSAPLGTLSTSCSCCSSSSPCADQQQ